MFTGAVSQPVTLRTEVGDEQVDLAEFEARARKGEISPQCLVRLPAVTGERFVPACELELFRGLQEPKVAYFGRTFGLVRFPWITTGLLIANLTVYALCVRNGPLDIDAMVSFGGKVGPLIIDLGELWRLFTASFLHRDALHVGLNLFVLFNVGGALENTYRALDYVWLLVFSGLATWTVSLLLTDAVSVGASGMVFGCLGGVVVFGLRYRSLLPARYRRVMGETAIPTVIALLSIGLTSRGVDNWAHLGGLCAGMLCAAFMSPRLLADPPRSRWSASLRALPTLAALLLVFFGQALWGDALPLLRMEHDDEYGLSVPLPRDWRRGANRLGQLAYYNGLPGLGRATFAAEAVQTSDPSEAAQRFVDETLKPSALGPEVLKVSLTPPAPSRVGARDAILVQASFEEPFGTTLLSAYFVPRGEQVYQLVFSYPAAYPRYAHVQQKMLSGIRFEEPRALRQARARALLFPNASWALGEMGEQLRLLGQTLPAVEALRAAVAASPSDATLRTRLALAHLSQGQIDHACEAARAAVLYAPLSPRALEAEARCEVAKNEPEKALARLQEALAIAPQDQRLLQAAAKLRAAIEQSGR